MTLRTRLLVFWVNVQHAYHWLRNTRGAYRNRRFAIYQANFSQTWDGYKSHANYKLVWKGFVPLGPGDPRERIFVKFQRTDFAGNDPPPGYMGRSLSVGDVIVIGDTAWAVEVFNYKRIKGFTHS